MSFKVGDKVRVTNVDSTKFSRYIGRSGVVNIVHLWEWITVKFGEDDSLAFRVEELEYAD